MVTEIILNVVFSILQLFLNIMPDIQWNIDDGLMGGFIELIRVVSYLFPMGTVSTIFGIVVSLLIFKAVVSLIKTVWALLPLV